MKKIILPRHTGHTKSRVVVKKAVKAAGNTRTNAPRIGNVKNG